MYKEKSTKSLNLKNVIFGNYFLLHNELLSTSNALGGVFLWNMEQFNHKFINALQIDFVSVPFNSFKINWQMSFFVKIHSETPYVFNILFWILLRLEKLNRASEIGKILY